MWYCFLLTCRQFVVKFKHQLSVKTPLVLSISGAIYGAFKCHCTRYVRRRNDWQKTPHILQASNLCNMKRPCLEFASLNLYNLHGVTVFFCLQRWRRRWFTLQQGKLPDEFLLNYYSDETKRKLKGTISLNDVEQVCFTHFKRIHIWNWSCCLL